jgi:hypothetical protein
MTTTTKLHTPRARTWHDLPVPQAAGIAVFCLYIVAALVGQIHAAPTVAPVPTPALPTQSRPVIVIQREMVLVPPLPTALPPTPQVVYVEVQAPAPEPEVVYVEVPAAAPAIEQPAMAVATPAPCYSAERQAMIQGVSIGVGIGTSCISQEDADRQAADQAFKLMNQRMSR